MREYANQRWWKCLEISNEVRATEVHNKAQAYYKASEEFGYKFLMEVKTIRDEKLFMSLGYSNFEEYTEDNFGYSQRTIEQRIQTANVWKEQTARALSQYGITKSRQLAQLPENEREKVIEQGIPTNNGLKSIEQATTREIEEYKRQHKEKDQQITALKQSYNELANQPQPTPVVKTIEKEVIPSDYEETKKQLERLTNEHQRLLNERKTVNEKSQRYDELTRFIKEAEGKLSDTQKKIAEFKEVHRLIKESNQFLLKASALSYLDIGRAVTEDPFVKRELESLLSNIERFSKNIKDLTQQSVIEGEIINE